MVNRVVIAVIELKIPEQYHHKNVRPMISEIATDSANPLYPYITYLPHGRLGEPRCKNRTFSEIIPPVRH